MPTLFRRLTLTAGLSAWMVIACQQSAQTPSVPAPPTSTTVTKQTASGSQDSGLGQNTPGQGQGDATGQVVPQPAASIGVLGPNQGNASGNQASATTPAATNTAGTATATTPTMDALQTICLDTINQYRQSIGRRPVAWKADTARCADEQVGLDGAAGTAHKNFGKCKEMAQDECPGWPAPMTTQLPKCLAAMWAEGPGGGHYENMANAAYTKVSCGIAQVGSNYWMVQNFYP